MNLLLYVKDPIYLYNILTVDLKLYVQNILKILDIIHQPDFNTSNYSNFLKYLMFKKVKFGENWTQPISYNGWSFNLYNMKKPFISPSDIEYTNVNNFFSINNIILLNQCISDLDCYNGYFNIDLLLNSDINYFENEFNILNIFNIEKLLKDFNNIFSINHIEELKFYSLDKFITYHNFNDYKSLDFISYNDLLNFMIQQDLKYNDIKNANTINENEKDVKSNLFLIKDDNFILKKQKLLLKRKSANASLYIKKKKTKIIKVITDIDFEDYVYTEKEVTDSDSDDSEKDSEKEKKLKTDIYQQVKLNVVSNINKKFRQ
jgi:hypothetical protein